MARIKPDARKAGIVHKKKKFQKSSSASSAKKIVDEETIRHAEMALKKGVIVDDNEFLSEESMDYYFQPVKEKRLHDRMCGPLLEGAKGTGRWEIYETQLAISQEISDCAICNMTTFLYRQMVHSKESPVHKSPAEARTILEIPLDRNMYQDMAACKLLL